MDGALGALPRDRAGSGSGLLMTTRQVGSAIGIALLGSLLVGAFRDRLDVTGLPAQAADTAGESVVAAHIVAQKAGSADLVASAEPRVRPRHGPGPAGVRHRGPRHRLLAAAFLPNTPVTHATKEDETGHGHRCGGCRTMNRMTAAPSPFSPADRPQLGLRERKKIKTREAIRTATYALVREQGYDATTIEQIAERAEVSPSTVFRYFPSQGGHRPDGRVRPAHHGGAAGPARGRAVDGHPPVRDAEGHPATASRTNPEVSRLRTHLMVQVPAVRSRMMESMSVTGTMLCQAIGERTGGAGQPGGAGLRDGDHRRPDGDVPVLGRTTTGTTSRTWWTARWTSWNTASPPKTPEATALRRDILTG